MFANEPHLPGEAAQPLSDRGAAGKPRQEPELRPARKASPWGPSASAREGKGGGPGRAAPAPASSGRSEVARRRYYIFSQDFTGGFGDVVFLNKEEALVEGRTSGHILHADADGRTRLSTGLPPLSEPPRVLLDAGGRPLQDAYGPSPWFVSSRAKALMARLDPQGFEFAQCETFGPGGGALEPYWMVNAVRVVEDFDETRSSFDPPRGRGGNAGLIRTLNDIRMRPDMPKEIHSFYLRQYPVYFIVDEELADEWRAHRLTGALFTPLQPPVAFDLVSDGEEPKYLQFKNYDHWKEEGLLP